MELPPIDKEESDKLLKANDELRIVSMNKLILEKVKTILNKNSCRDLFSDIKLDGDKIYKNVGYRRRIQYKFLQKS